MRVFYPFAYYYPEQCAGIFVVDDVMREAAKQGVSSYLSVPTPTRDLPKDASWLRNEVQEGGLIRIHRFRMYGEGRNPLLRALRYLFCECAQMHGLLWKKYDVAFIDSTPPIQGLKMPFIKLFRRKPIVYNAQDIFPDSLVGTGLTRKGSLIWRIGRVVEKITYKYADKIIVISEDFRKNLLAKGVPEEKIEVVYNWVDENAVTYVPRSENKLFEKYGLNPEKFYVTYNGNIGLTQNMDMLLEAAEDLADNNDIQFVLVGNGAYLDKVKEIIAARNLKNIHLLPFQPYEDIAQVFSLGDVSIVISKAGVGANSVPSKTWSIMSASRPVLASFDENELKTIIESTNSGIFTKAGDKDAFVAAIKKLYGDRELCEKMGKNGRQFVLSNLTKATGTKRYVEIIKSVVKQ
ncbi:MAG: glycosyltransferase family 4 protein [Bacteroidales bacterium]|nr:glycosyltransferase family 4 protein [Bacteroidales bacterium]